MLNGFGKHRYMCDAASHSSHFKEHLLNEPGISRIVFNHKHPYNIGTGHIFSNLTILAVTTILPEPPFLFCRYCKIKRRVFAQLGFHPDASAMSVDYPLADCKTYTGAGVIIPLVQTLEYLEYAFIILRVYAYSVISYGKYPSIALPLCRDMDGRLSVSTVFY